MYMHEADLFCDDCGRKRVAGAEARGDEDTGDSDDFPQDVSHLDDTSDSPQHCGDCGVFMENALTDEGLEYVVESIIEDMAKSGAEAACVSLREWAPFYLPSLDPMYAFREDIVRGAYWACVDYHGGQWSRGYRHLSKLSRHFKPAPMDSSTRCIAEGGDALAAYIRAAVSLLRHP